MKFLRYNSIILVALIFSASCKKSYLNVNDNTVTTRQQYVTDLNSTQQFLNGVYVVLGKDFYMHINQIYPDLIADNIKISSINTSFLIDHYSWNQNSSNSNSNRDALWQTGYQLIHSSSFVIENATRYSSQDPAKARQLQAEAYCIRALVHFILVNTFAQSYNFSTNGAHPGIPYITTSDWTQPYSRNTVGEVYNGIIGDLNAAIPLFTSTSTGTLIMNKNAAKALLARCFLFKEDFQQAKSMATEVATAVPLMSGSIYPSKLFTLLETEALFQLAPASTTVISGSYNTAFEGFLFRGPVNRFLATQDIAALLTANPTDVRKSWISSGGVGKDTITKFPNNIIPGFGTDLSNQSRSYYITLLRSSEMFLTVAEASARSNDEPTARTYLDYIRKRADPFAVASSATGPALLDSIYTERRKELAFEGLRMFDLLRWKKGVSRSDVAGGAPTTLAYGSNKAIAPIPFIDSQSGVSQNPGY